MSHPMAPDIGSLIPVAAVGLDLDQQRPHRGSAPTLVRLFPINRRRQAIPIAIAVNHWPLNGSAHAIHRVPLHLSPLAPDSPAG